jgi:protein SCO1/2
VTPTEAPPSSGAPPDASDAIAAAQARPLYKNPWLIGFLVGAAVLTLLPIIQGATLTAPPPLASLGDWSLTDHEGKPIGSAQMKGKVWMASVFFARCPSMCPPQQTDFGSMLKHVEDLDGKIELLTFSVDPEYDVPDVLAKYHAKMTAQMPDADKRAWHFVTGAKPDVYALLVQKMKLGIGEKTPVQGSPDLFDIAHAAKFVLVDQNGDIRGFWDIGPEGRGNLINAARLLAKKGPNP